MSDKALNEKQYAALLGVGYSTFRSHLVRHPEQIAPSFDIGGNRRWWYSTILDFHKSKERQGGNPETGETY